MRWFSAGWIERFRRQPAQRVEEPAAVVRAERAQSWGEATLVAERVFGVRVGSRIQGQYLVRKIRSGGMAIVFLCVDERSGQRVAVKAVHPRVFPYGMDLTEPSTSSIARVVFEGESRPQGNSLLALIFAMVNARYPTPTAGSAGSDSPARGLWRFVGEATHWLHLGSHPNIVELLEVRTAGLVPLLVLEYVDAPSHDSPELASRLRSGPLDLRTTLSIGVEVCAAMGYAQSVLGGDNRTFSHRDLNPRNILLTPEGTAKVTDFGLATLGEVAEGDLGPIDDRVDQFTKVGSVCGTPPYMAPEQFTREAPLDERTDIYATGCVLFEMISGRHVFDAQSFTQYMGAHLRARAPLPATERPLAKVIRKCLEKSPRKRFQTFSELGDALASLQRRHRFSDDFVARSREPVVRDSRARADACLRRGLSTYAARNWAFGFDARDQPLYDEVVRLFAEAAALDPANAEAPYCSAEATVRSHPTSAQQKDPIYLAERNSIAMERYKTAVTLNPALREAWLGLGKIYLASANTGGALEAFQRCGWRAGIAEALDKAGRKEKALEMYRAVLANPSEDFEPSARYPWFGLWRFWRADQLKHLQARVNELSSGSA